jgi:cysteine desulfurase
MHQHSYPFYFDNASTTPIAKDVLTAMLPYFGKDYGNPSSLHSLGRKSATVIYNAKQKIANILNATSSEIIFTGSGTESICLALVGIARANRSHGNHILVSSIEHKAVLESVYMLNKEGFVVEYIPVSKDGLISVDEIESRITPKTIMISVMYANNEIGTILSISEIGKMIHKVRGSSIFPIFHTDACQAAGYLSLNVQELLVDCMSINSSKIYGPKGVGLLYKNKNVFIEPLIVGGGQEYGVRSGTENIPGIVGFSEALIRVQDRKDQENERLTKLRDSCIYRIKNEIKDVTINGHEKKRLPNNIHCSFSYIEGESLLLLLDEQGICVSTGSACSSHDLKPSHVLVAIKQDPALLHGSIRITFGEETTQEMCDVLVDMLKKNVSYLRSISPSTFI